MYFDVSRKRLEALGYILRQNYEDIDDYRRALEENARYQAVKDKQQERAEGAEKSYQVSAVRFLALPTHEPRVSCKLFHK